jgi:Ca2+-binding RTX toxin-like protein
VETLVLEGSADLQGYGNGQANTLHGNSGNNLLDGDAGADSMIGGAGNDLYVVDNAGDVVFENANEGADAVQASITYTLTANVEGLVLTGSADINGTGNTLANTIIGNSGNNTLNGDAGNDTLDGGAGADTMIGGTGDDAFFVDNGSDVVTESDSEGNDTVYSTVHYTLSANVENLILQGTADLQGYGNSLSNSIYGNAGNNILDGRGGADAMYGGAGDDAYFVDNAGDVVTENPSEGNDVVFSTAHFSLSANVETLVLQGSADLQGYGNSLNNAIYGNSGNNLLDGSTGADTMAGGTGNDLYVVDNTSDVVSENAGQGTDAVQASVTYTLSNNVENLALTGSANINATGNSLSNLITGNSGNNTLTGGADNDTLVGNGGNDALDGGTGADGMSGGTGNDSSRRRSATSSPPMWRT